MQQIFNQINSNYNDVKTLANQIYEPVRNDIDFQWAWADHFSRGAVTYMNTNWASFNREIWQFSRSILSSLEKLIDEMFMSAFSTRSKIQDIFNYSMAWVVEKVKSAVLFVQDEMYTEVDLLKDSMDASIYDLELYLDSEVERMHNAVDLLSIDVITWIDAAVGNLADTLMSQIEEVNTNLTARIDFIETWTAQMFQAIYDYVDIRNEEMLAYINDANATLYIYINSRVKELDNYIGQVQNDLNARLTSEVNILLDIIQATEVTLTDKINKLAETTGWNFSFFDLFTFKPELSLLRVLLRSDAEFERYKPYWQALFARILAED